MAAGSDERPPPSRARARRLVLTILAFWWAGVLSSIVPAPFVLGVVVAALACGFVFFYTVSEVLAEGTGLRPLDYWNGIPGRSAAPAAERRRVGYVLLRPRWWATTIDASGWPRLLVVPLLVVSLAAALATTLITTLRF